MTTPTEINDVLQGGPPPVITVNEPINAPRRGPGRPPGSKNRSSNDGPPPRGPQARVIPDLPRKAGKKDYRAGIEGSVILIGDLIERIVNPVDGQIIKAHAKDIATGWNNLAAENASVAKVLDALTGGSAWGAALMPTMSMALAIAANHNALPNLGGMFAPPASQTVPSENATASGNPTG